MANTHLQPSMMAEMQSNFGDLLAPVILGSTLTTPGAGLTLPAFTTVGYVVSGSPKRLCFVSQPAAPVTLAGGDGAYWLALHHDTHSVVAAWTRQAGTHYLWQAAGTQPADPPGGLVLAGVTVAGGTITAVDTGLNYPPTKVAYGGPNGQLAFDRHLTYAANGSVLSTRTVAVLDYPGDNRQAFYTALNAGTNRWAFFGAGTAPSHLGGTLTVSSHLYVWGNALLATVAKGWDPPRWSMDWNGDAYIQRLGVGTGPGAAVLSVGGTTHLSGHVGIGQAPDGAAALAVTGSANVTGALGVQGTFYTGSNSQLAGNVGIGTAPGVNALTVSGATLLSGTLLVQSTVTVNAPLSTTNNLFVSGTSQLANAVGIGVPPPTEGGARLAVGVIHQVGYNLTTGSIYTTGNVNCTQSVLAAAKGYQPGGGPWLDSSSRTLKRNIRPLADALALLLAQQGYVYEWEEPSHAALLPGDQYGFVLEDVTIPQWRHGPGPDGHEALAATGFEALTVEALREIVTRLEALEGAA